MVFGRRKSAALYAFPGSAACATLKRSRSTPSPTLDINPNFFAVAAAVLYLGMAFELARRLGRGTLTQSGTHGMVLLLAIIMHGTAVWQGIYTPAGVDLSLPQALSLMLVVMSAFLTAATFVLPVASLMVLVAPIAAATVLFAAFASSGADASDRFAPLLLFHITASISAVSVLMLAFLQALLLWQVESDLKSHTLSRARLLPPLETMERLLFAAIWAGLALMLLAIGSGFAYLEDLFSQRGMVHHTVLLSAAAGVYATLLIGRYQFGWRGATAVRWVIGATILLVLGYFGSKFVIEILLSQS